jgi:hypothetical protein
MEANASIKRIFLLAKLRAEFGRNSGQNSDKKLPALLITHSEMA